MVVVARVGVVLWLGGVSEYVAQTDMKKDDKILLSSSYLLARPMLTRATLRQVLIEREGTVRALAWLVVAVLLTMSLSVSPALARVVRIQTAVTLADRSDPAIKQALMKAFDTSLRGPVAMGLPHVRVEESRSSRFRGARNDRDGRGRRY